MSEHRRQAFNPLVDLAYMEWHRTDSIARYLDPQQARTLKQMDLDSIEINAATGQPCAAVETTRAAVDGKTHTWTRAIAEGLGIPGYVTQYVVAKDRLNPCNGVQRTLDIDGFIVLSLPTGKRLEMTPSEYAAFLVGLRSRESA